MAELTAQQIEAERRKFEAWIVNDYYGNLDTHSEWDEARNCYTDYAEHLAWKAWLARASEVSRELAVADQGEAVAHIELNEYGGNKTVWHDNQQAATMPVGTELFTRPAAPGWKLVPIEPTEEMWTAGRDPVMYRDLKFHVPASMEAPPWRINPTTGKAELDQSKGTTAVHVWRAMIAAAPSPKGDQE